MPTSTEQAMSGQPPRIAVDRHPDGIAVIRIDRPPENLTPTWMLQELQVAAEELSADPPGAVMIWGGEKIFSGGGDTAEFEHFNRPLGRYIGERFHAATAALAAIPRVTVAAITGLASGGGLELALACDFRIVGESAKLRQHEIEMGLFPGGGGTQRLPRLIGVPRAKRMIFTGETVEAAEALRIGLADEVVADASVFDSALAMAEVMATGPAATRGLAKRAIDRGIALPLFDGLQVELDIFEQLF
jgi:enoyl-CoA hydratase/carnithine racemase